MQGANSGRRIFLGDEDPLLLSGPFSPRNWYAANHNHPLPELPPRVYGGNDETEPQTGTGA